MSEKVQGICARCCAFWNNGGGCYLPLDARVVEGGGVVRCPNFDPQECPITELEQRISGVNDANLYGLSQLEERIDALERRIEKLERKLNHKGGNE